MSSPPWFLGCDRCGRIIEHGGVADLLHAWEKVTVIDELVVNPVGQARWSHVELVARPPWDAVRSVGLLENTKPKAAEVLQLAANILRGRNPDLEFVQVRKDGVFKPATPRQLAQVRDCDVVLVGTAECGSCTSWCVHDCVELERTGTPSVLLGTRTFEPLARFEAETFGYGCLPMVMLEHPISGSLSARVAEKMTAAAPTLFDAVTTPATELMRQHLADCGSADTVVPRLVAAPLDLDEFLFQAERSSWTDGLPVIPPTPERVARMLDGRDPTRTLGEVAPFWAPLTLELAAANAVMAGCAPEHFDALTAALTALTSPDFNLYGLQATTHPAAPLLIFSGAAARAGGLSGGAGAFGPGHRANATIGRAVRLVLWNVGGAHAGDLDRATLGHPGKFTYCIAENADATPWEPLHVDLGQPADASTVTVAAAEAPQNMNDPWSTSASALLHGFAGAMSQTGSNNHPRGDVIVVLGPEHAAKLAAVGLSRSDVKQRLFDGVRTRVDRWSPEARVRFGPTVDLDPDDPDATVRLVESPDKILVVVAGGVGAHSMQIPTMGFDRVTRAF